MNKYISSVLLVVISLSVLSCKKNSENSNLSDELIRKEIELKEKEIALKEKEIERKETEQTKLSQSEVEAFVEKWISFQNNKAVNAYASLYDPSFRGIKRTKSGRTYNYDYSGWIADRTKMYRGTNYLNINASDIKLVGFDQSNGHSKVGFMQTFFSDNYSDEGMKIMTLIKDRSGEIKISYEELLYSKEAYEEWCSQ